MEKLCRRKKVPVRSAMSDEELASLIKRDREDRPYEFIGSNSAGGSSVARFNRLPAVYEVIAKWL